MVSMKRIPESIVEVFYRLNVKSEITTSHLKSAFRDILCDVDLSVRDVLLGAFLTSIMVKGAKLDEVVELLITAFELDNYSPMKSIELKTSSSRRLVGIAGSGKKGIKTINISTPSAILAASLGAFVAKSGSFSTSSITGSADFMHSVGVNINSSVEAMIDVLKITGLGFFSIENLIPKFDSAYGKKFYALNVLSFGLAALVSPVKFDTILFGLAHPDIEFSVKVLREFGMTNARVVSCTHDGIHFLDEVGIYGETRVIEMQNGYIGRVHNCSLIEKLKLPKYKPKHIAQGKTKKINVKYTVDALRGTGQIAHEDVICVNAANILYLSNVTEDLIEGYYQSKKAIKQGLAIDKLLEVIEKSNGDKKLLEKFMY